MLLYAVLTALHLLSAIMWVGGMFFAYCVVRTALADRFEPAPTFGLWLALFRRFFRWAGLAVVMLFVTGFWMILEYGGFGRVSPAIHIMVLGALVMTVLFLYLLAGPYPAMKRCLIEGRHEQAARNWCGSVG